MRILVLLVALLISGLFVWSMLNRQTPAPAPAVQPASPQEQVAAGEGEARTPAPTAGAQAPVSTGAQAPASAGEARPELAEAPVPARDAATEEAAAPLGRLVVVGAQAAELSTLGSLDKGAPYTMQVQIAAYGAGIHAIHLRDYYQTAWPMSHPVLPGSPAVAPQEKEGAPERDPKRHLYHYTVQRSVPLGPRTHLWPFAARAVQVNGQRLDLQAVRWRKEAEGVYSVEVVSEAGRSVLRITRRYELSRAAADKATSDKPLPFDLTLRQELRNLSGRPLEIVWEQNAQADLPPTGDPRLDDRSYIAAFFNLRRDPQRQYVFVEDPASRMEFMQRLEKSPVLLPAGRVLTPGQIHELAAVWPPQDVDDPVDLAWLAMTNRYFAAVLSRPVPAEGQPVEPVDALFEVLGTQRVQWYRDPAETHDYLLDPRAGKDVLITTLTTRPIELAAGETARLDLGLFAGPRERSVVTQPAYQRMDLPELLVYQLGCTLCTFQPVARGLLAFLSFWHTLLGDWAIAIIILVLVVRLLLHPLTKKSQTNMMVFQKQMQKLQPELEKLKKKYADEPQRMQQEQMRLWKEHGINPLKMLGCLPLFLQMPIWVALYAMLYFAIELRHEPAFYGVFQWLTGSRWHFLADLASPDRFISFFDEPRYITLLPFLPPFDYSAFNILPILWAVVLYLQQRLMTPPATTEQQAQQQKMMRIMVFIMPVFLYGAPSALTLYFLASTGAGILDSYLVRKHIREQEEAGTLLQPKPKRERKPGGFMDRLMKAAEASRAQVEARQRQQQQGNPPHRRQKR